MELALPSTEQDALMGFAAALREVFGGRLLAVRLFGSAARGEYGPDSDLDVAVIVEELHDDDVRHISLLASEASLAHDVLISPLPLAGAHLDRLRETEQRLARDIEREGVPL